MTPSAATGSAAPCRSTSTCRGRLGAFYIDEHSNKVTPVMLHRAMFGSLERFFGILLEHYAGHLPLWLSPLQAVVATITEDADAYAREVIVAAQRAGLRVEGDLRNEKINYKVREHSLAKVRPCSWSAERKRPSARSRSAASARRARRAARCGAQGAYRRGGGAGRAAAEAGGVSGRRFADITRRASRSAIPVSPGARLAAPRWRSSQSQRNSGFAGGFGS